MPKNNSGLKKKVEEAMHSPKVSLDILTEYKLRTQKHPGMDLYAAELTCIAQGYSDGIKADGLTETEGGYYVVSTPYAKFPGLVDNKELLRFMMR